jgi:predicted GNAT family acetyltransferase
MREALSEVVKIRLMRDEDRPFIFKSMLNTLMARGYGFEKIERQVFFENYVKVVEKILNRASSLVAVSSMDDDLIYGFMLYHFSEKTKPCIHFQYVKDTFRKMGIGKKMFDIFLSEGAAGKPIEASHMTELFSKCYEGKGITYNPFAVKGLT